MKRDPSFAKQVREIEDEFLDFVEWQIKDEGLRSRNPRIMEKLMRILLKGRGYDEAEKFNLSGELNVVFKLNDIRRKRELEYADVEEDEKAPERLIESDGVSDE